MQFFSIHDSTSTGSINFGFCSTSVFTIEKKNLCINGPVELKPILFKGQSVCVCVCTHTNASMGISKNDQ